MGIGRLLPQGLYLFFKNDTAEYYHLIIMYSLPYVQIRVSVAVSIFHTFITSGQDYTHSGRINSMC